MTNNLSGTLIVIRDWAITTFAGYLLGVLVGVTSSVFVFQALGYQEGWYKQFAPYLLIPIAVFVAYIWLIPLNIKVGTVLGILGLFCALLTYLMARKYLPIGREFGWIEFTAFWVFVAQLAALLSLGSWRLFWTAHFRARSDPASQ